MADDLDYSQLDPGIRTAVRMVRILGFTTTDSGDGVSKVGQMDDVLPFPHVVVKLETATMVADTERLQDLAQMYLGPDWRAELSWSPGGPAVAMLIGDPDHA
jgi:hypothetical protein